MDKNIIEGGQSGTSVHNFTKSCHSALGVNGAVGQRRFQCLPMEVSLASVRKGAPCVAIHEVTNEKSADIIVVREELGAERCPFKLRNRSSLLS